MGLAGLGDLVLTCTGDLSRNRRLGLALGRGQSIAEAVKQIGQVVESVDTVDEVMRLGDRHGIELPISGSVGLTGQVGTVHPKGRCNGRYKLMCHLPAALFDLAKQADGHMCTVRELLLRQPAQLSFNGDPPTDALVVLHWCLLL